MRSAMKMGPGRKWPMIGLGIAVALQGNVYGADYAAKSGSCFRTAFSRENGPVKDVSALFTFTKPRKSPFVATQDQNPSIGIVVEFSEWDVPNYVFSTWAECSEKTGALNCIVDCDGGTVSARLSGDGRLFLDVDDTRFYAQGDLSSVMMSHVDGDNFKGLFVLAEQAGNGTCAVSPETVYVPLQAGDISDRVRDLETKLNSLGEFVEFPDEIFDAATSEAVKSFQRQYGLPATGIVDSTTSAAIANIASRGPGLC